MNSNFGKSTSSQRGGSASLNSFDFDLGLSSNQPRSLNDQKHPSSSFSSAQTRPKASARTPSWQPNKPSWTHQPAPRPAASGLSNATAPMVGDILGKSWSSAPPSSPAPRVGIVSKDPKLFGDLLNSALGQGKNNINVPLKNAPRASPQTTSKNSNSSGNLADLLPKTGNQVKGHSNSGSSDWFGSFRGSTNVNNVSIGGRSTAGFGGSSVEKDPFGSLVDFGSKEPGSLKNASKSHTINAADNKFGVFQNPSNPTANPTNRAADDFSFMESSSATNLKIDDFRIPTKDYASQRQPTRGDPLSMFNSPLDSGKAAPGFSEIDDWGFDLGLGGGEDTTTELDELPPPPGGVSATAAMMKGMDSQKQGQYADSIKWLSWAVILFEKGGDVTPMVEVLSCRASCYKEVGEYKKAVADCTKVLELDGKNVVVLVQRALLYESMEKYKLGAEDLRAVMKLDPGNRVARSTIHRLTKMAG